MTLIRQNRTQQGLGSFYSGSSYTPDTIGNWVAVDQRDMPWNTIGKALDHSAGDGHTVDHLMTAKEALAEGGLDITVDKYQVHDDRGNPIPKLFVTGYEPEPGMRHYFGAVTDRYQIVQPAEALEFFDGIVNAHNGSHYSAVWEMRDRAQLGVTIELPESIVVDPGGAADESKLYILGGNSVDGSSGLRGATTAVRPWCMNQLAPTWHKDRSIVHRSFSFKHTTNVAKRMANARTMLGVSLDWAKAFDEIANQLHAEGMTDRQFERLLDGFDGNQPGRAATKFRCNKDDSDVVQRRVRDRREHLVCAWRAPHNANITKTRWGAFNVLAEYADWGRSVHGSKRSSMTPERMRAYGTLDDWPVPFKSHVLERLVAMR